MGVQQRNRSTSAVVSVAVAAALALMASACSGESGGDEDATVTTVESTTTESVTTTEATTTTTEATTTTEPAPDPQDAVDTWIQLMDAARTGEPDADQTATIEALADEQTVTQMLSPLFPPLANRELTHYTATTPQDDGTIAIDDCIVMNRGIATGISNWFTAMATPNADSPTGWTISQVRLINLETCVPRTIAQAAIEGYEAHNDAANQFYNPPDADSPLVGQTTTGGYQDFVIDLIDDLAANGQIIRGRPTTEPGFAEFNSPTALVIIDCQEVDPDFGVYDEATGERTDLAAPVTPGRLDLVQATMLLEGGTWKVSDLRGPSDVQCRTPPTPETLDIAGG